MEILDLGIGACISVFTVVRELCIRNTVTHMDKSGDGPVPLSARIPRRLSVEVKVLPVKSRP